jgi:hypothetical protein
MITISSEVQTQVTPEFLAVAFWSMSTEEQTRFFASLAEETKKSKSGYAYGEMQWCMLQDEIRKNPEANQAYMALSLWAYDFLPVDNERLFS